METKFEKEIFEKEEKFKELTTRINSIEWTYCRA